MLNPEIVKQQIDHLLLLYPELVEDEVLLADSLEGETDLYELLRQIERKRRETLTMTGALAAEIAQLEVRQGRFERREQAMRDLIFKLLERANMKKVELPEATFSIRQGTAKVLITDEAEIPDSYCRIKREPNKLQIKEALNQGETVPGATLSNQEPSLSIRTK